MSSETLAVEILDLGYSVNDKKLLKGITLKLPPGRAVRIIGETGVGKTTLGRILTGAIPSPIPKKELKDLPRSWLYLAGTLSVTRFQVPSNSAFIPPNPRDRVVFPTVHHELYSFEYDRKSIEGALHLVGLDPGSLENSVDHLSGGQLQRLVLAQVALQKPNLLVLDEVREWLDVPGQKVLFDLVADLTAAGGVVVFLESDASSFQGPDDIPSLELTGDGLVPALEEASVADLFPPRAKPGGSPNRGSGVATRAVKKAYQSSVNGRILELRYPDMNILAGEWVGVTGPNGSGKSVLARILAGIEPETGGVVEIGGVPSKSRQRLARVGYVSQFPDRQLGLAKVSHVLRHTLPSRLRPQAEAFLETHSGTRPGAFTDSLTACAQRMVILAVMVARAVEVLIVDEPTWGADALEVTKLGGALEAAAQGGCSLIVISHREAMLSHWCDRTLRLSTPGGGG